MPNTRIIYEKGIELVHQPEGYWMLPGSSDQPLSSTDYSPGVFETHGLRPIVLGAESRGNYQTTLLLPSETDIDQVLMSDGQAFFTMPVEYSYGIKVGEIFNLITHAEPGLIEHARNLKYALKAIEYHCIKMAETYARIIDISKIFINAGIRTDSTTFQFSGQEEPWFEFDSLVTASRTFYEILKFILWNYFGPGSNCPNSYKDTLPHKNLVIPEPLKTRLEANWNKYGLKIRDYRDCIIHHSPIEYGWGAAEMIQITDSVWGTTILLPDNPEDRSKRKFKYKNKTDSLSYSWMVVNELLSLTYDVANHIRENHQ